MPKQIKVQAKGRAISINNPLPKQIIRAGQRPCHVNDQHNAKANKSAGQGPCHNINDQRNATANKSAGQGPCHNINDQRNATANKSAGQGPCHNINHQRNATANKSAGQTIINALPSHIIEQAKVPCHTMERRAIRLSHPNSMQNGSQQSLTMIMHRP